MLHVTKFLIYIAPSGLEGGSAGSEKQICKGTSIMREEKESGLLNNNRFYENMLVRPRSQL